MHCEINYNQQNAADLGIPVTRATQATMWMDDEQHSSLADYSTSLQLDPVTVIRILVARSMKCCAFCCDPPNYLGRAHKKITVRLSKDQMQWVSDITRNHNVSRSGYLNALWVSEASKRTLERYMEGKWPRG